MELFCRSCKFEDVLPIWSAELWPNRASEIETNSAMKWLGGFDMLLMSSPTTFWCVEKDLGVLSGHFGGMIDNERSYRTRGLWVAPNERRIGIGNLLMDAATTQARLEGCKYIWTFPRKPAMPFYESLGFQRVGPWAAGEFGPNCYALKTI